MGFEYWLYLLYDDGDVFLDRDDTRATIRRWFEQHFIEPLHQRRIPSRLVLTGYDNVMKKPGPAFNFLTHLAFVDGADWLYRINDDSLFTTPFASAFVHAMKQLGPPYGVVGPVCLEGVQGIFTYDFTHRTHHEIMPQHYPHSLADWWMDDWITRVYGKERTKRVEEVVVQHLIKTHGRRYEVDLSRKLLLGTEVELGRRLVERWLADRGMAEELRRYQADDFLFYV